MDAREWNVTLARIESTLFEMRDLLKNESRRWATYTTIFSTPPAAVSTAVPPPICSKPPPISAPIPPSTAAEPLPATTAIKPLAFATSPPLVTLFKPKTIAPTPAHVAAATTKTPPLVFAAKPVHATTPSPPDFASVPRPKRVYSQYGNSPTAVVFDDHCFHKMVDVGVITKTIRLALDAMEDIGAAPIEVVANRTHASVLSLEIINLGLLSVASGANIISQRKYMEKKVPDLINEMEKEWRPPWCVAMTCLDATVVTDWRPPWAVSFEITDFHLEDKMNLSGVE